MGTRRPGRPPKGDERRDIQVQVRLTRKEEQKLRQAAAKIGYSLSKFVRIAAYKAADQMLSK